MKSLNIKRLIEQIEGSEYNRPAPNSTLNQFALSMKRKGLKELGAGAMALVFQSEKTDEVIKVFRKDDCFLQYLKLVSQNTENPHFPKIHSYQNLKTPPYAGLHLVKMEKLQPVTDSAYRRLLGLIKDLVEELNLVADDPHPKQEYLDLITQLKDSLNKAVSDNADPNRNLYDAIDLVAHGITGLQCSPDLHKHNIMKRQDGTLVIIDPYI